MDEKISIDFQELEQLIHSDRPIAVIDVRSKKEYDHLHIPFSINIPIEQIDAVNSKQGEFIITVCSKGSGRSEKAAKYINENLYSKAFFLEGGTFGWFMYKINNPPY